MPEQEFGSDGQTHDTDRPLASLAAAESKPLESVDPFEASEPGAAAQLRAFEDKHLGKDTPRFQGLVERGHGAPLRFLSDDLRREHASLERAIETERSESEKGGA